MVAHRKKQAPWEIRVGQPDRQVNIADIKEVRDKKRKIERTLIPQHASLDGLCFSKFKDQICR